MDLIKLMHGLPPWIILGAGFLAGWLKSFWNFFYDHTILVVEKKIRVSLTIEEQDHKEAFKWINCWMEEKLNQKKISILRLEKRKDDVAHTIVPGYGFYYIWWKKKLVTFWSTKKESNGSGYDSNKLIRTIEITIWGTRNRKQLLHILEEAQKKFQDVKRLQPKYFIHRSDYWDEYSLKARGLHTIYLPDEQLTDILETVKKFHASEEQYSSLGIPYRLGLLLYGPPGSGKSTIVQALATHFKLNVYYVNLSQLNAAGLADLLSQCESPCIVLMEDIDCIAAAANREEKEKDSKSAQIKANELLNLIDGLVATEERILVLTTNHPEKLDHALVRSGRIDRKFHIPYAAEPELKKFYTHACKYYQLPDFVDFRRSLPEVCTIADAQAKIFELTQKDLDKDLGI